MTTDAGACSSDPASAQVLAKDDVVKLHLGAHIDGFAAVAAETLVVGASAENPVTGRRADTLKAAWHAAEIAMRLVRAGNKNWAVTDAVNKTTAAWDCKAVEGAWRGSQRAACRCSSIRLVHACVHVLRGIDRHAVMPADSKCH